MNKKLISKQNDRLSHVKSHIETFDEKDLSARIINRQGNSSALFLWIESMCLARAMVTWFDSSNLVLCKQYSYNGAIVVKLRHLLRRMQQSMVMTVGSIILIDELLLPLISDNEDVIHWLANDDGAFDLKAANNHKTDHFWAYQSRLALRGEWDRLRERCETILADPPRGSSAQKYLVDQHFYLALANGDIAGMEEALAQITSPKGLRGRNNNESGYSESLICTHAVIYAKMAWRHGYQVSVDTPFIPVEWLPVTPLESYEYMFSFMESLNVDTVEEFSRVWAEKPSEPPKKASWLPWKR